MQGLTARCCNSWRSVEKGMLVEFRLHGDRHLGVVERPEGKKHWIVVDDRGHSHTLHPRQVIYELDDRTYRAEEIDQFRADIADYLDPSSLEVAWELLVEDGHSVNPAEMAQLLFSDRSPALCYAAHCLLSDDKLYFKQKGDRYDPRPATQVAELQHQQAVEAKREQEWQEFLGSVQQTLAGQSVEWQSSDRLRLEVLEKFAAQGEDSNRSAPAMETLELLGRDRTPQAAFQLLVDLRIWSPHENLLLHRYQIPVRFSDKVIDVAQSRLTAPPPDRNDNRLDLTHLKVYTIDDESTQEIDDGLSVEFLEDGRQRLWIHIADPTRWLEPGDDLDLEARRRATTIYLPTGMIPMFPPELATGPMSLVQGEACCALSFGALLDEAGGVEDYTIHSSTIRPTYRLTYEDVDEILDLGVRAEPELTAIADWATRRETWRQSQGAISIRMPESSIKVSAEEEIAIKVLEDSQARQLVAEMMILAGEIAARYAVDSDLAVPFRNQPQPELPSEEELLGLPAGPVRFCAIRRCMPRSEVSLTPSGHSSLGLGTYTQVTSPIRRYSDLIAHFQLKAHLRGDPPPFSKDELKTLVMQISTTAYEATLVERQTNRYWGLEYLRRHNSTVWPAMVLRWLREHEKLAAILIEDLGLELAIRFPRHLPLGQRIKVKVKHANPRHDAIEFEVLDEQVEQAVQPATS